MASRAAKVVVVVVIAVAAYLYLKSRSSSKSPYAPYYLNDDGSYYVDSDATYGEPPSAVLTAEDIAAVAASGEPFPAYLYYPPGTPIEIPKDANLGDLVNAKIALSPGTIATGAQLSHFNDEVGSWLSCASIAPDPAKGDSSAWLAPVGVVEGRIKFSNNETMSVKDVMANYNAGVYDEYPAVKEQVVTWVNRATGTQTLQYDNPDYRQTLDPGSGVVLMATDPNDPNKLVPLTTTKPVYQTSTTSPSQPFGTTSIPAQTIQQTAAQQRAATTVAQIYATQVITPLPTGVTKMGGTGSAGGGTAPKTAQSATSRSRAYTKPGASVSMSSGLTGWGKYG